MAFVPNRAKYKVWVFAPYLETDDAILKTYYDYTQSIEEFSKVFTELNCEWEWVNITLQNLHKEIERVRAFTSKQSIVFNL